LRGPTAIQDFSLYFCRYNFWDRRAAVKMSDDPPVRALLIIDVQNDFISGSLQTRNAEKIVPVINALRRKEFDFVYVCLDWHPVNHCSFQSNNPGTGLFETVHLPCSGIAQTMWPDHCKQGSWGAELHQALLVEESDNWTMAGCNPEFDSYSVFKDNESREYTELKKALESKHVTEVYAVGIATDYTVQHSVLDAKQIFRHAKIYTIIDACAEITEDGKSKAMAAFEAEDIHVLRSTDDEINRIPDRKVAISGRYKLLRPSSTGQRTFELIEDFVLHPFASTSSKREAEVPHDLMNTMKQLVNGESLQISSPCGVKTIIQYICSKGNIPCLHALFTMLPNGALDLSCPNERGENVLFFVFELEKTLLRSEVTQLLLENCASDKMRTKMILTQDKHFRVSPLMLAARVGDASIVQLLLSHDHTTAHLSLKSKYGVQALMYACMGNTDEHCSIVEMILSSRRKVNDRFAMLSAVDNEGWNSIHFAVKSGCFAKVDWERILGSHELKRLNLDVVTKSKFTPLQIAAANGMKNVIQSILEYQVIQPDLITVNQTIQRNNMSELDLALRGGHFECVRLLLRLGVYSAEDIEDLLTPYPSMQEILCRLVLMNDIEGCVSILNHADENKIDIDESLVSITKRMLYAETCTYTFANRSYPLTQFMYQCEICNQILCLVCNDTCRRKHGIGICGKSAGAWRRLGLVESTCCTCNRATCSANHGGGLMSREAKGYGFVPAPLDTTSTQLTDVKLLDLVTDLATNAHNLWAAQKVKDGWKYAKTRDEKLHPLLVPFGELSNDDQSMNQGLADEFLKVILKLGYKIQKSLEAEQPSVDCMMEEKEERPKSNASRQLRKVSKIGESMVTAIEHVGEQVVHKIENTAVETLRHLSKPVADSTDYQIVNEESALPTFIGTKFGERCWDSSKPDCQVVDTSTVSLPASLTKLILLLAQNSHNVWAKGKMDGGWRYSPESSIQKGMLLSSELVPWDVLTNDEKIPTLDSVREQLKVVLKLGWKIGAATPEVEKQHTRLGFEKRSAPSTPNNRFHQQQSITANSGYHQQQIDVRNRLLNQFLLGSIRTGSLKSVHFLLLKARQDMFQGASMIFQDSFGHTPLYLACKRGQLEILRCLLSLGADASLETKDTNGLSPLAISSYLGNFEIVEELVNRSAELLSCDGEGFTPLHHAILQGHEKVTMLLLHRLKLLYHRPMSNLNAEIMSRLEIDQNIDSQPQNARKWSLHSFKKKPMKKKETMYKIHPRSNSPAVDILEDLSIEEDEEEVEKVEKVEKRKLTSFAPLTLAISSRNLDLVKILVQDRANPMLRDTAIQNQNRPWSPYDRALYQHIQSIVEIRFLEDVLHHLHVHQRHSTGFAPIKDTHKTRRFLKSSTSTALFDFGSSCEGILRPQVLMDATTIKENYLTALNDLSHSAKEKAQKLRELRAVFDNLYSRVKKEYGISADILVALNLAPTVSSYRRRRAFALSMHEIKGNALVAGVFLYFVTFGLDLTAEREWYSQYTQVLQDLTVDIHRPADLHQWIFDTFRNQESPLVKASVVPGRSAEATIFMGTEVILGGIQIEYQILKDALRSKDENEGESFSITIPTQPDSNFIVPENFLSDQVRMSNVVVSLYNPYNEMYGSFILSQDTSLASAAKSVDVEVQVFRVRTNQFPPSTEFEIALVITLIAFIYIRLRELKKGINYENIDEVVLVIFLIVIAVYDRYVLNQVNILLDGSDIWGTDNPLPLIEVAHLIQVERHLFSAFLFLCIIPIFHALKKVPSIGPVLVAIARTLTHNSVIVYLIIFAATCLLVANAFFIGFSHLMFEFENVLGTADLILRAPFIGVWDFTDNMTGSSLGYFVSLIYLFIATIALNLLVAIVTYVYPLARRDSDKQWETLITAAIEDDFSTKRGFVDGAALTITRSLREKLLQGMDGIKHWKPSPVDVEEIEESNRIELLHQKISDLTLMVSELLNNK